MWRDDFDYEDERQSSAYPRLSGRHSHDASHAPLDVRAAPDLSTLTDEEFHRRLDAMRAEHERTLALCDEVGLKEGGGAHHHHGGRAKNRFPIASVDADYTLSTHRFSGSPEPVYGDYTRSSFKASPPPPTTRHSKWNESGQLNDRALMRKYKKEEALKQHADDHRNDRMNRMQKYIDENIDFLDDDEDGSSSVDSSECKCEDKSAKCTCGIPGRFSPSRRATSATNHFVTKASFAPHPVYAANGWKHTITIPKPFGITKRAESAVPHKSRTMREYEELRAQERWREMHECNKRITALPLPANTYLPLYERMREERERKRTEAVERRKEALREMQAPFSFDDRERRKHAQRNGLMREMEEFDAEKPNTYFKARPFPKQIFDPSIDEKLKMEEELRRSEAHARADDLMRTSNLPPNMRKPRPAHRCFITKNSGDSHAHGSPQHCHNCEHSWRENLKPHHGPLKLEAVGTSMNGNGHCGSSKGDWSLQVLSVGPKGSERWPDTNLQSNKLSRSLTDMKEASAKRCYCSTPTHPSMCSNCSFKQTNWTSAMQQELERYEDEDNRRKEEAKYKEAVKAVDPSELGCESINCTERRRPYLIPKKPLDKSVTFAGDSIMLP